MNCKKCRIPLDESLLTEDEQTLTVDNFKLTYQWECRLCKEITTKEIRCNHNRIKLDCLVCYFKKELLGVCE